MHYRERGGVDVFRAHARFVAPKVLEVDGEQLTARHIVVAVGLASRPPGDPGSRRRPVPHVRHDHAHRRAAAVDDRARRRVHRRRDGSRLLELRHRRHDPAAERAAAHGRGRRRVDALHRAGSPPHARRDGRDLRADRTGRRRRAGHLDRRRRHRVEHGGRGAPGGDRSGPEPRPDRRRGRRARGRRARAHRGRSPTSAPAVDGVWAFGDVANHTQLKHMANAEMRVVRHNLTHPDDLRTLGHSFVPHAVFTDTTDRGGRDDRGRGSGLGSGRPRRVAPVLGDGVRLGARGHHRASSR